MRQSVADRLRALRGTTTPLVPAAALVGVQLVFFGVPAGAFIRGTVLGLLTALLAIGMALVYRANRVINFAQADLGYVPTALAVGLVVFNGLPYLLGLSVGLVGSIVLGAIVELALVRRFVRSPRLVLTVATLGITQLLAVLGLMMPKLWGENAASQRVNPPLDWKLTIGTFILNANDLIALVVAPLAMVAVGLFLSRTRVGTAVRASAERTERAALLGIPTGWLSTLVWMLAAGMSFLALFMRAGILGVPIGNALSIGELVLALAALVIGRLRHLPTIAFAAVALGILEYGISWNASSPLLVAPFIGVAVMTALLLQRRGTTRLDNDTTASWRLADEIRALAPEYLRVPAIRLIRWAVYSLVAITVIAAPVVLRSDQVIKLTAVVVFALVGLSLVVLTGWAGQISLGQFALVGIGAAVGTKVTTEWNVDLLLALVIAGIAGAVAAFVVGLPALRLRGLYLAVVTLVFALSVSAWLLNDRFFSWIPKERLNRLPLFGRVDLETPTRFYAFAIIVLLLVLAGVRGIRRSRTGRAIIALRDNERGAQAFAVPVIAVKLAAFTISGAIAGVSGALFAQLNHSFDISSYDPSRSLTVFSASIVGGLGAPFGAVLGAVWIKGAEWFITADEWRFLSTAVGQLIVLLVVPGGLAALIIRVRDDLAGRLLRRAEARATTPDAGSVEERS